PALDAVALEGLDDGIGHRDILRRVADKDGRLCATARLLVAGAFSYFSYPRHLCGIVADALSVGNCRGHRVTQDHRPPFIGGRVPPKWLFWVTVAYAGCRLWRAEKPRVGGSIPPLA